MRISVSPTDLGTIRPWRDMYRLEMACQIIHDSIHQRPGWTAEYLFRVDDAAVGYGSVAIGGPWTDLPTIYEYFVVPPHRARAFELFDALLVASEARAIEIQSNDMFGTVMLHTFADDVRTQSILFADTATTAHRPSVATFRHPTATEASDAPPEQLRW